MREILLRLVNHAFYLLFWMACGLGSLVAAFFLVTSNVINFSDSWNEVHPSVPVVNDAFFNVIISIFSNFEVILGLPHHATNLMTQFDYGHGYAITQTLATLILETIMAWSGWTALNTYHQYHEYSRSDGRSEAALNNIRLAYIRHAGIFLIFFLFTGAIWVFDIYLTYAKQDLMSERTGASLKYVWIGPIGSVLLMTVMSLGLAFIAEELRREIVQITSDIGLFFERLFDSQPSDNPPIQGQIGNGASSPRGALEADEPHQPPLLPPQAGETMLEVHSVRGTLHISVGEMNQRWANDEIRLDGRTHLPEAAGLSSAGELFQALNPPENDSREWYYTIEGLNSIQGEYELDENQVIVFRRDRNA